MTDLQIRVDATEAVGLLGRISDNFPRARTWALNRTAEEVNVQLQREADARMIFRGAAGQRMLRFYAPTRLPGYQRAQDNKPYVTAVDPRNAGKILRPFETGKLKVGRNGQPVAIPTRAIRPTPEAIIPRKYFPTNLFPETRTGGTLKYTKSGKVKRSKSYREVKPFVIQEGTGPRPGIYRRVGAGRGQLQMLWAFRSSTQRPHTLNTYTTSNRVVSERWAINMAGMFRNLVRLGRANASLLDLTV